MKGTERIVDRILGDARKEAERILAEQKAECDGMREEYLAEADRITKEGEAAALAAAESKRSVSASGVEMEHRRALLAAKTEQIDAVYRTAKERILLLDRAGRLAFYKGLLSGALSAYAESVAMAKESNEPVPELAHLTVVLSSGEEALAEELFASVCLPDGAPPLRAECVGTSGGLILRAGEWEFNCTLPMLLAAHKTENEGRVYQALFA